MKYSYDGNVWETFTPHSTVLTLQNAGDRVYFKGNNPSTFSKYFIDDFRTCTFKTTGSVAASGNVMSLKDDGLCEDTTIPCRGYFFGLFKQCIGLTTAPELPAIILAADGYSQMFYGCTSLTRASELPATTVATNCYYEMFYGCTALITPPELPATTLAVNCYSCMFQGCTSLTTAPELPATTLANECYSYMFDGCTSLTTAPALPATVLAEGCYYEMFLSCTSLTTAPKLPATTLGQYCYEYMFDECTSLQVSDTQTEAATYAWRIPTSGTFTNEESQYGMFSGCAGTRSSDDMEGVAGQSYTYYTQNEPI